MKKEKQNPVPSTPETEAPAGFRAKLRRFRRSALGDLTVALVWVAVGVLLGAYAFGAFSDMLGIMKDTPQTEVTIKAGWTTVRMANEMRKSGVIKHPLAFTAYAMLSGSDSSFKSGTYLLDGGMSYDEIISTVQRRQSSQTVRITFTEGMNSYQIGTLLEENGVCLRSEFLAAINSGDYSNYNFLPSDYGDSGRFYLLEGYLFPDTYDFYVNENVNSVVKRFLNNFNNKFTEKMRARANEMGMSIDQVVTLASIIEKEATDVYEMAKVSSVFHNRLTNPSVYPKLQSDVTAYYVKGVIYKVLTSTNDAYNQAYNTYVRNGLPVGAICNPGGASLTAALYPAETSYYYFVTDSDANFYYASNLSQHNANIRKAGSDLGGTYTHD